MSKRVGVNFLQMLSTQLRDSRFRVSSQGRIRDFKSASFGDAFNPATPSLRSMRDICIRLTIPEAVAQRSVCSQLKVQ
jgi:hypothetical protein